MLQDRNQEWQQNWLKSQKENNQQAKDCQTTIQTIAANQQQVPISHHMHLHVCHPGQFDTNADYSQHSICFFDPSADIDDEFALIWMAYKHKHDQVWVICGDSNSSGTDRLQGFLNTFSQFFTQKRDNRITLVALEDLPDAVLKFKDGLVCGPVGNLRPNLLISEKLWLQGSLSEKSFNTQRSETFLEHYQALGQLQSVSTAICSKAKPTDKMLAVLPEVLKDRMLHVGFKLMAMRMPPDHAVNRFAEGLVNPEVGRGANQLALKSFCEASNRSYDSIVPSDKHEAMAAEYFEELIGHGGDVKDKPGSVRALAQMNAVLEDLMPGIWDGCEKLYYSNASFDSAPALERGFQEFKKVAGKSRKPPQFSIDEPACRQLLRHLIYSGSQRA